MKRLFYLLLYLLFIPILGLGVILISKKHQKLIWGCTPVINNKYWSAAMRQAGFQSLTIMTTYYKTINKREDYDYYLDDFVPKWLLLNSIKKVFAPVFTFFYCIKNASVMHIPFDGGPLGNTPLWKLEASLYRISGIKTIVIPYGADAYLYSQIIDPSVRNALLLSYPDPGKKEEEIKKRVKYWSKEADIIITGLMIDGIGRWNCTLNSSLAIDVSEWKLKSYYSKADGKNGTVKVMHTPNHRGFKGTEFLVKAVNELKQEGLKVELILLEGVQNSEVRDLMQEVDILAEQFIIGYAMSAVEGMASGLPVMSNLENEAYTRVFRRYSYLNECPILSSTPENLKENLRILITNPQLRKELGQAGRQYIEKYHSYETAQYLFGSIYDKILYGKDIDLMNLFHPLKSSYNSRKPYVQHPLEENKLPKEYYQTC